MSDRLKSFLDANRLRNPAGLEERQIKLLADDLRTLDKVGDRFPKRALRYVVDGEDAGILLDLAVGPEGGHVLQLRCTQRHGPGFRTREYRPGMLTGFGIDKAAAALRLAQVYEAASRAGNRHCELAWLGGPAWLEIFLAEAMDPGGFYGQAKSELRAEAVEAMLALDEADTSLLARGALLADPADWNTDSSRRLLTALRGIGESIVRHPEVMREAMGRGAAFRAAALKVLHGSGVDPEPFAELLADEAVSSAKTVREAAEPLVRRITDAARPFLRDKAESGSGPERDRAVRLIWKLDGEAARTFLEERSEKERSTKVLRTLHELVGERADGESQAEAALPEPAPLPRIDSEAPLPESVREDLRELCRYWHEETRAYWAREKRRGALIVGETPDRVEIADEAWKRLRSWVYKESSGPANLIPDWYSSFDDFERRLKGFLELPEIELIHFVRLMVLVGLIRPDGKRGYFDVGIAAAVDSYARHYRRKHPPAFGLRELAAAFRAVAIDDRLIGLARLHSNDDQRLFLWEKEAVWAYFAEHPSLVEEALELREPTFDTFSLYRTDLRRNALQVLGAFPSLPAPFHRPLWEIALGKAKTERPLAQAALETVPGYEQKILAALASGKQEVRAEAALWLGRLGCRDAVPRLREVLSKEEQEVAKSAMLTALEQLGTPIRELLDREGLAEEAAEGLAKGIPAQLEWFPFDLAPAVRWADSGKAVSPDVLCWFVVRSYRLKSPEPGPLLRRYCQLLRPEDREALGQFVLVSWIAQDTATPLEESTGSAIREKGVLAVAGACCGAGAVAPVRQYLKRWYGMRAAQCKALVRMLSWIESPSAVQLLLSVANRFRTASIRKEADQCAQALAERQGWTVAEMADRTVPTAGFELDETGTARLVLDCGERRFTAHLDDDLAVVLSHPDGKVVKSLPGPRKGEDPDLVKAAKKQLSAARKELKAAVKLQRERLYEAMCTQRGWAVPDWRTYLAGHPILGRFCQRLVWAAFEKSGTAPAVTFRLLADGSLTDADDEEVTLADGLVVRLAHDCNTPADVGRKWLAHLDDYEVSPLFTQFGREPFRLDEEKSEDTELEDFEGHLLEAFKLRSEVGKLGYVRAQAEDGGWFYSYHKHFPTLRLEAVLEFTGNFFPEENRTVALRRLYFVPTGREEHESGYARKVNRVELGELPAVLLGESWNDLKNLSALGTGYDPEWEKKTAW